MKNLETMICECPFMECGGKRSATPLWMKIIQRDPKRRRRFALPAHSK
jgi:hypothetical protein